jgi:hypothetical protein
MYLPQFLSVVEISQTRLGSRFEVHYESEVFDKQVAMTAQTIMLDLYLYEVVIAKGVLA